MIDQLDYNGIITCYLSYLILYTILVAETMYAQPKHSCFIDGRN